jgi:hypothetical protein
MHLLGKKYFLNFKKKIEQCSNFNFLNLKRQKQK